MMLIECPNCGRRSVQEFRYGGEINPRPARPRETATAAWAGYVFMRRNRAGPQTEWWFHRDGCHRWFLAERDTRTNEIARTYFWAPVSLPLDQDLPDAGEGD